MTTQRSFVDVIADSICAQYPSGALDTALAVVANIATRKRLEAVRDFSRGKEPKTRTRPDQVIGAVCRYYGMTPEELKGSRHRRVAYARFAAWHVLRTELKLSTLEIGTLFSRDHTSVMRCTEAVENNAELAEQVATITATLRAQWGTEMGEAAE